MSDHQYLMAYPVTVDNVEEWLGMLSEVLASEDAPDGYQGRHERDEF